MLWDVLISSSCHQHNLQDINSSTQSSTRSSTQSTQPLPWTNQHKPSGSQHSHQRCKSSIILAGCGQIGRHKCLWRVIGLAPRQVLLAGTVSHSCDMCVLHSLVLDLIRLPRRKWWPSSVVHDGIAKKNALAHRVVMSQNKLIRCAPRVYFAACATKELSSFRSRGSTGSCEKPRAFGICAMVRVWPRLDWERASLRNRVNISGRIWLCCERRLWCQWCVLYDAGAPATLSLCHVVSRCRCDKVFPTKGCSGCMPRLSLDRL